MRKRHVILSDSDRATLQVMLSKRSLTVKIHNRIESLFLLDSGSTFRSVSQKVGSSFPTLQALIKRYKERQLNCLQDKTRPGRPITITGEERAKITASACSKAPKGHSRWSLRLLADKVVELGFCDHLSYVHAGEILKKTNYSLTSNANGV